MFRSLLVIAIIAATAIWAASTVAAAPSFTSSSSGTIAASPIPFPECPAGTDEESPGCVEKPDPNSAGASAQCRDGSYSHSQHRSGTCSGHHGVAQWCPCGAASGQSHAGPISGDGYGGRQASGYTMQPNAPAPSNLTCPDVGGVFVAHGTDGRGDCMPADPRPKCHVPPSEQDAFDPTGNYLAELTMTPPFPGGTLDPFAITFIEGASNRDCWKLPS